MHHASATANQSQQPLETCRLVICGDIPGNVVHRLKIVNKSRGSNSRRSAPPRGGGRNRDISFMNRAVQTFYVLHTLEFRKLSI